MATKVPAFALLVPLAVYGLSHLAFAEQLASTQMDDIIRVFNFDYVLFDFVFLCLFIGAALWSGRKLAVAMSVLLAVMIYPIDAIGWYFEVIGTYPDGRPITKREYSFDVVSGRTSKTLTRFDALSAETGDFAFFDLSNQYVQLKHLSDFMMLLSYCFVFWTWSFIMIQAWRPRRCLTESQRNRRWYAMFGWSVFFLGGITVVSFLSTQTNITGVTVRTVRHMTTGRSFRETAVYVAYAVLALYGYWRGDHGVALFSFFVGSFQAFTMIAPLYLFGIRPFRMMTMLYEVLYLINSATPFHVIIFTEIFPYLGINPYPEEPVKSKHN